MSVINKMLKDLEQREQKPGADFESNNASAVYQPKKRNSLALILGLMFVVILLLAGAVSWLLFNNTAKSLMSPVTEIEQQSVAEPQPATTESQPKQTLNTTKQPDAEIVTAEAPVVIENAKLTSAPQQPFVVTEEYLATERAIAELDVDDEEIGYDPDEDQPVEQSKNIEPTVQFKIEKTPSNLTREQRLAKLMEKANSSFDKGYITDAITQLEEVLNSADGHVEARNLLAVAWYGRGELQQAVSILNNGLNRHPNIEMWRLTAAKIFFKENELPGAFSYLEADLPNASSEYYSMKGTLARQLKRFDKAETAYANLTKLEPNKGSWWLGHAIALDSQNKSELAINSYKQAITRAGISPTSMKFAQQRIQSLQE